jgi:hypothetical protein
MKRRLSARRAPNKPAPLCGHDDELIEAAALDLLEPAEQGLLAERLATCATCRARLADSSSLTEALRHLIPAEEPVSVAHETDESPFVLSFRARHLADERRHGLDDVAAGGAAPAARPGGRRRVPVRVLRVANVVSGLAAALLLLVLVGGFWFLSPGRGRDGSVGGTRPRPTATATPGFPQIPYLPGGIPTTCVNVAPTATVGPLTGAVGAAPFWIGGFVGPQATIRLGTAGDPHVPYGWHGALSWTAQPGFTSKVTVTGANMSGGGQLWFQASGGAASLAVLDPLAAPTQPAGGARWATGSFLVFVPRGGCYTLQATWPGGSWQITFAAGNPNESVATIPPTP